MPKLTNEEVTRLARRATAHIEANVEAIEISAKALETLMWELLLLRKRAENKAETLDLETAVPRSVQAGRTMPGTIRAMGR